MKMKVCDRKACGVNAPNELQCHNKRRVSRGAVEKILSTLFNTRQNRANIETFLFDRPYRKHRYSFPALLEDHNLLLILLQQEDPPSADGSPIQ
jgi:hypothetical protein